MGCVQTKEAPEWGVDAPGDDLAPEYEGECKAEQQLRTVQSFRPGPSAQTEKLSSKTLERLRSRFLLTATRGSVYDYYTLGRTLGACARGATHARSPYRVCLPLPHARTRVRPA